MWSFLFWLFLLQCTQEFQELRTTLQQQQEDVTASLRNLGVLSLAWDFLNLMGPFASWPFHDFLCNYICMVQMHAYSHVNWSTDWYSSGSAVAGCFRRYQGRRDQKSNCQKNRGGCCGCWAYFTSSNKKGRTWILRSLRFEVHLLWRREYYFLFMTNNQSRPLLCPKM